MKTALQRTAEVRIPFPRNASRSTAIDIVASALRQEALELGFDLMLQQNDADVPCARLVSVSETELVYELSDRPFVKPEYPVPGDSLVEGVQAAE